MRYEFLYQALKDSYATYCLLLIPVTYLVPAHQPKRQNQIGTDIYPLQILHLSMKNKINAEGALIQRKRYNINKEISTLQTKQKGHESVSRLRQSQLPHRTEPSQRQIQGQRQYRNKYTQGFNTNHPEEEKKTFYNKAAERICKFSSLLTFIHIRTHLHALSS